MPIKAGKGCTERIEEDGRGGLLGVLSGLFYLKQPRKAVERKKPRIFSQSPQYFQFWAFNCAAM
jgi:hypothetical protein